MARSQWQVEVEGQTTSVAAGHINTALYRALSQHPMPPMGQVVIIKVWRVGTVAPRKRR